MAGSADLSIIIPIFNRDEIIRHTFASVARATGGLVVEQIVVDDGSSPPTSEVLGRLGIVPTKLVRQPNQGLLFARLAGLRVATGRYVLFLDSDDVVGTEKLRRQVAVMDETGAAVSYTDTARCDLGPDGPGPFSIDPPAPIATDAPNFFLRVQPGPHSPIFRRDYLIRVVAEALFPPSPRYNPVAEIWFYYNAAIRPARVVKVDGPHTIVGVHAGARLTNHWERLALASLAVMEAFARACPRTPDTLTARMLAGECAFRSWRGLPKDFHPLFGERLLALWRQAPRGPTARLGTRSFAMLARLFGAERAASLLRRWRGHTYASCRTMDDVSFARLLAEF